MKLLPFYVALFSVMFAATAAHAEDDKKIRRVWQAKCSACHGADGAGATDQGKKSGVEDMTSPAWQKARTDAQLNDGISKGVKRDANGKKQEMDAFGAELKAEQIDALVKFVRSVEKK